MLGGDGGDELFGGYTTWYRPLWNMEHYSVGSSRFVNVLLRLLSWASPWGEGVRKELAARLEGVWYREKYHTLFDAHRAQRTYFSPGQLSELRFETSVQDNPPDAG